MKNLNWSVTIFTWIIGILFIWVSSYILLYGYFVVRFYHAALFSVFCSGIKMVLNPSFYKDDKEQKPKTTFKKEQKPETTFKSRLHANVRDHII
jgi:hypothetical protein